MPAGRRADLAYVAGVIAGIAFLAAAGAFAAQDRHVAARDSDFAGVWAGARATADGHDPYDPLTWRSVAAVYGTQAPDTAVYGYPRWVTIALVPLALLPFELAATCWLVGGIALSVVAVRALLRALLPGAPLPHALIGGLLFVSQPGYQTVVNGQWTYVLLAAAVATLLQLRAGRPRVAAAAALGWLAKPQLFIGYALGGARRDRRFARWAAILAAAVVGASFVGAAGWAAAWSAYVAPQRIAQPATIYAAATDVFGRPAGLIVATLIVAIGIAVCLRQPARSDASLALWSIFSLAAAPYAWSYDLLLLIPGVVAAAGVVARRDARRAAIMIEVFAVVFVLATPGLYYLALLRGRETFSAVLPLAAFIAAEAILWRETAAPRPD